uniref:Putative salivary kunitz domain protein n=1 Tax=Ixodes ricinus TaxID=34613 RepID=A0A0K8R624_IXORI
MRFSCILGLLANVTSIAKADEPECTRNGRVLGHLAFSFANMGSWGAPFLARDLPSSISRTERLAGDIGLESWTYALDWKMSLKPIG